MGGHHEIVRSGAGAQDGDVGNRLIHEVGHFETGRKRVLEQRGAEDRVSVLSGGGGLDPGEQFGGHYRLLGIAQSLKRCLGDDARQLTLTVDDLA